MPTAQGLTRLSEMEQHDLDALTTSDGFNNAT